MIASDQVTEVGVKYLAEMGAEVVPVGYKQTEVGVIPEDWVAIKMGDLAKIQRGASPRPIENPIWFDQNSSVGWLRISDVSKTSKFLLETTQSLSALGIANSRFVPAKSLVMSICATVGKPVINCVDLCIHDGFVVFNGLSADYEYMYYILKDLEDKWGKKGQTGSQMNLNTDLINGTFIAMPLNKLEQTTIANTLSDVDALINELEKLITKKQAIKTATMQQLLTGRTRLPQFALREDGTKKGYKQSELGEIPEDWVTILIGKDAVLKARIGWQALTTQEYLETGAYYLVTGTDFDVGSVKWESCCFVNEWRYKQDINIQLKENDVLITKDGTIGKVGYVSELSIPATLNSGVFVIRSKNNRFVPRYLFYVLTSNIFELFMRGIKAGSTITHLYQKDFVTFSFSAPELEEQTAIATILSDMDTEIQTLQQRLSKTRQIKQGMMQELLTGKTRLIQRKLGR